ncbi:hypothetical protein Dimus_031804 [Dionaea muscipula]
MENGNPSVKCFLPNIRLIMGIFPRLTDGELAELTWENGQLAMHELGGNFHAASSTKPTWCRSTTRTADTLESIVHQATCHKLNHGKFMQFINTEYRTSFIVSAIHQP